ncbi:MAG TPA: hypothetical protein VEP68_11680 [Anaeromyxobacteraceae bacterium]|nr:hypothetical protein [Anaeromyxobacteraceae bacterium]
MAGRCGQRECGHQGGCELFARLSLHGAMGVWIENYCHADPSRCRRWQLARQGAPVPWNLLPNGRLLTSSPEADPR